MRQVGIIGIGHTKFGKTEKGFLELLGEAALLCFEDAQITPGPEAGDVYKRQPTKLFFCFGMLAGRLEIMPILLLFFPSVWSNR